MLQIIAGDGKRGGGSPYAEHNITARHRRARVRRSPVRKQMDRLIMMHDAKVALLAGGQNSRLFCRCASMSQVFHKRQLPSLRGEGGGSAAVSRNEIDLGAFINRRLSIADLAALKAYNEKRRRSRFLNVTLARFMEDYSARRRKRMDMTAMVIRDNVFLSWSRLVRVKRCAKEFLKRLKGAGSSRL